MYMLVYYETDSVRMRTEDHLLTAAAAAAAGADLTVMDKRFEFVSCLSHDSLIHLLSDHLRPKGEPILSSCPFKVQREHTDIWAAENIKLSPS